MSSNIYKVFFKGIKDSYENKLSLTFKSRKIDKPISLPSNFFIELKKLSEIRENLIIFKNLEEVIEVGNINSIMSYNHFKVILFTSKYNNEKSGFLMGSHNKLGEILIAAYPFNREVDKISIEKFKEKIHDLIKNPNGYINICLIN